MPITGAELLAPVGEIEPAFFPGEGSTAVQARLDVYVQDGYTKVPATVTGVPQQDAIAKAWGYYRAYDAIYKTMSRSAASKAVAGEASSTTLATQIAAFKEARDDWYNEAISLIPSEIISSEAPGSTHGRVVPDWPCW